MESKDLKKIRAERNMTQQIFASFIGVSAGTVSAWEQDVRPIPPKQARVIKSACLDGNRRVVTGKAGDEIVIRFE